MAEVCRERDRRTGRCVERASGSKSGAWYGFMALILASLSLGIVLVLVGALLLIPNPNAMIALGGWFALFGGMILTAWGFLAIWGYER